MTQFARDFISSIEGTKVDISTKELSGGARIYYIFNDVFLASIDSTQNLDNSDIRTAIRNSTGPRLSLFVPESAFDLPVKPQIKFLKAPSLRCIELVYVHQHQPPCLHPWFSSTIESNSPTASYAASVFQSLSFSFSLLKPSLSQPSVSEVNGTSSLPENEEEPSEDDSIFPPRDSRSVSSTLHDRSRNSTTSSSTPTIAISKRSSSKTRQPRDTNPQFQPSSHREHSGAAGRPRSSFGGEPIHNGTGSSPPTARETFLTYLFGQNGPGLRRIWITGIRHHQASTSQAIVPVGRDMSVGELSSSVPSGLMVGKRGMDVSNAAYDMKSLGKHIEVVRLFFF